MKYCYFVNILVFLMMFFLLRHPVSDMQQTSMLLANMFLDMLWLKVAKQGKQQMRRIFNLVTLHLLAAHLFYPGLEICYFWYISFCLGKNHKYPGFPVSRHLHPPQGSSKHTGSSGRYNSEVSGCLQPPVVCKCVKYQRQREEDWRSDLPHTVAGISTTHAVVHHHLVGSCAGETVPILQTLRVGQPATAPYGSCLISNYLNCFPADVCLVRSSILL